MIRVVAGVVVREGRLLAARRATERRHGGRWELAGGKVEPGEDDATALARELLEELGVVAVVGPRVGEQAEGDIVVVAYACTLVGEPSALEHAELRWLAVHELGAVEWTPADRPLVAAIAVGLEASQKL